MTWELTLGILFSVGLAGLLFAALAAIDADAQQRVIERRLQPVVPVVAHEPPRKPRQPDKPAQLLGFAVRCRCEDCGGESFFGPARNEAELQALWQAAQRFVCEQTRRPISLTAIVVTRGLLPRLKPVHFQFIDLTLNNSTGNEEPS